MATIFADEELICLTLALNIGIIRMVGSSAIEASDQILSCDNYFKGIPC